MLTQYYTYLALGDSYTIGEGVPLHESFPYQTIQLLRNNGLHFNAVEIVAKTGWTSFELANHIQQIKLNKPYNFVSLLIGVNDEYRGLPIENFKKEFELLLQKSIAFADGKAQHVIVLSIPDWGVTPFAEGRDTAKIAAEIDSYNAICQQLAKQYGTHYINITTGTRLAQNDESLLTADKLHYSANEMSHWATEVAAIITKQIII